MQEIAERAEQKRDLAAQLEGIGREDEREIIFKETSPARRMYTIFAMTNGEPIRIPYSLLDRTLAKRLSTGGFMFTATQSKAPEYKLGTVKCFLHPESLYRTSGMLAEAGVAEHQCASAHLASEYAMEEVAKTKHRKQWAALQSYIDRQERNAQQEMQQKQLDATLALAGRAAQVADNETCADCDFTGTKNQLRGHRMGAHKS